MRFNWLPCLALAALLPSCDGDLPAYVTKQGFRHGSLLLRGRPVDEVLNEVNLSPKTEHYLKLSKQVLAFARGLGMKTNGSYKKFIALDRDWVTQIVMSAEKASLTPRLFHYPIVGDLPYRGFYDESDAVALENKLSAQGYDVYRRKVEAFSTTGWLPDPLVTTMFSDEGRFVELLFHELTHSTFYFANQADFNEAFASWMGYRAALEFAAATTDPSLIKDRAALEKELALNHEFQLKFAAVVKEIVAKGKEFYAKPDPLAQREPYFAWIKERLGRDETFKKIDPSKWNNATILSLGTYYELVGPIEAYARKNGLSPKDFLARVVARRPAIIQEIVQ